jgi:protein-disulfide isomerase
MHDAMFANIQNIGVPALKQTARGLGIDGAAFDQCLDSGTHAAHIRADYALGEKMGVNSTPTIYINGRPLLGAQPFDAFKQVIDEELARAGK